MQYLRCQLQQPNVATFRCRPYYSRRSCKVCPWLYIWIHPSHPPFWFEHSKLLLVKENMDMYQHIAFIIVVVSGAAILAYCAADDTFLSFAQKHWRNDMKCGKAFCLCRTFWERVKVQVMEGSHVRKKIFWALVDRPLPAIDSTVGSLFTDLVTCRDLHWVVEIPLKGAFINVPYTL